MKQKTIKLHATNIPDDIDGLRFQALSRKAKINYVANFIFIIALIVAMFFIGYFYGYNSF